MISLKLSGLRRQLLTTLPDFSVMGRRSGAGSMSRADSWASAVGDAKPVRSVWKDTGARAATGVIGFSAAAVRTASNPAGVVGVGDGNQAAGVRGEALGPNAGVVGISNSSSGVPGPGVYAKSTGGIGVSAIGDTGVYAEGKNGLGLQAMSAFRAQINLVPSTTQTDPTQFPISEVGDLAVTITDPPDFPSLWFCVVKGGPGQAVWKKIA